MKVKFFVTSLKMINVVHGKTYYVCQWTGEAIKKRYRIPDLTGNVWSGCYGSPSVAVSGIMRLSETKNYNQDQTHELIDHFESSIHREAGWEREPFTIIPAPSFFNLTEFGGTMSLLDFHKAYEHDKQVEMFYQYLSETKNQSDAKTDDDFIPMETERETEKEDTDGNYPKKWWMSEVPSDSTTPLTVKKITVPRCLSNVVEFLRKYSLSNRVTLSLHPSSNKTFGIGCESGAPNDRATELLGRTRVFGSSPKIIHKSRLRPKKLKTPK